jgi:hypothetical protein
VGAEEEHQGVLGEAEGEKESDLKLELKREPTLPLASLNIGFLHKILYSK